MTSFQNSVIKLGNSFFQVESDNVYSNGDAVLSANISPENKIEMSISFALQLLYNIQIKLLKFIKSFKKTKALPERKQLEEMLHKSTRDRLLKILNDEDVELDNDECKSLNTNDVYKSSTIISNNNFINNIKIPKAIFNYFILSIYKLKKIEFNFKFLLLKYG